MFEENSSEFLMINTRGFTYAYVASGFRGRRTSHLEGVPDPQSHSARAVQAGVVTWGSSPGYERVDA